MNIPVLDNLLNSITTYRVVLYCLTALSVLAIIFGFLGLLPYSGLQLFISLIILSVSCLVTNSVVSYLLKAPTNVESQFITAYLLFCILTPAASLNDALVLALSGVVAMLSKYVFVINKKHIFNPTAISVFIIGFISVASPSWWIGSESMQIFIAIAGFLILKKLRLFYLFFTFLAVSIVVILLFSFATNTGGFSLLPQVFTSWPTVFFGVFMLTEPQTMPSRKKTRTIYAALVGLLSASQYHIGPIFSTPQFALLLGNIYSFVVNPKVKLFLHLKDKVQVSSDIYNFVFHHNASLTHLPGQYMEWTLAHKKPDSRGTRRYFTIASSPTEKELLMGVRLSKNSSSYKRKLSQLSSSDTIVASQIAGDFVLPNNTKQKLVFLAGGIGITPFRSMVQYLIDKNEKRDIILLYSAKTPEEFAYRDIFAKAKANGVKAILTVTDRSSADKNWKEHIGRIDAEMLKKSVPDYKERFFYLSGPQTMINAFEKTLKNLGVSRSHIKKDYFPGFA